AAKAPPLAHGHHEIQALLLRNQRRVAVLNPSAIQQRRGARNAPAAVRHRQKDAKCCSGRHDANVLCWRTRSLALRVATGKKTPNSALAVMLRTFFVGERA